MHIVMSASLILSSQNLEELPESFIRFVIGLTKDDDTLTKSAQYLVSPPLLRLVAPALCTILSSAEAEDESEAKDKEKASRILDRLIRSSHLIPEGAIIVGNALLGGFINRSDIHPPQTRILSLLRTLYLLHPERLQSAIRAVKEEHDEDLTDNLDQLMIKMTMVRLDCMISIPVLI
jgi:hypothetical protein